MSLDGRNLGDACVAEALEIIAQRGLEALSLREVARRVGVSHQAPYRHYPTRDHLLAEVMRRCFREFADVLRGRERFDAPLDNMHGLGRAYLRFAVEQPLKYRLMFGTPWPDAADHPELVRDARCAFDVLRCALRELFEASGEVEEDRVALDAMFVWSSMHGLATILESNAVEHLDLSSSVSNRVTQHTMMMIDAALLQVKPAASSGEHAGVPAGASRL